MKQAGAGDGRADYSGRTVPADGEMGADRHNAEYEHEESVPAP